jgi:hypothetical protein
MVAYCGIQVVYSGVKDVSFTLISSGIALVCIGLGSVIYTKTLELDALTKAADLARSTNVENPQ